tara:strand:+ start:384 stop:980 length:597 start_codon:yes stop_codon:yes gene_type:complete
MPKINLMNNGTEFSETITTATTVGALRNDTHLNIPAGATINVDRTVVSDDNHPIEDGMNVAVVSKDKVGGVTMRKRKKGSYAKISDRMKNDILLDIEDGMSVRRASDIYGVGTSTIHKWRQIRTKTNTHRASKATLSTTNVNSNGMLVTPVAEKIDTAPKVKELHLHLSAKHVPQKGQLRVTRELLDYINEVGGAHLS